MKKKVVLEGRMCDVCGRMIRQFDLIPYDDGSRTVSHKVGEKILKIRMDGRFGCNFDSTFIERQSLDICGECAEDFARRFREWKTDRTECGKKERDRLLAKFYE